MRILGIETSCDETSAAVVDDGRVVRSNIVASQIPLHERFGGVVPEIASRQHVLDVDGVTQRALDAAGTSLRQVDAIAVTYGPGLSGALMVGATFAKGLSIGSRLPLLAVNHIEGHILSVWLTTADPPGPEPEMPMVCLVASGGHTELYVVRAPARYELLGRTLDDAAGEAFDKVGRLLGLAYPGGPSIEIAAQDGTGDSEGITMPRAWLQGTYDFSFSGLKTAMAREVRSRAEDARPLDRVTTAALARAFQESVADVLARKLVTAVMDYGARSAAITGGVANNLCIRETLAARLDVKLHVPGPGLSSDNAAMISGAAFWSPLPATLALDVDPSLSL
jgi:N6-L-threonylcarbamoyladenine synthase